ncbi:MAG: dimethylarginine dimethylaminohydrolase family protein [Dehalococcoidia bacterium]
MTNHVLMCEPVHYEIAYEINPWMHRSNAVDTMEAAIQWEALFEAIERIGVKIELVDQMRGVPDMTFTANAGIAAGKRFIPANFRYEERQQEEPHFIRWFRAAGYEIEAIHLPHYWEGEGDVLDGERCVFAGHRFRTENRALDHLDELLGAEVVRLELTDPRFYHLDTCFCPLGAGRALWYPPAFSEQSQEVLSGHFPDLVGVPDPDALRFACNALVVDDTVVLNAGCPATVDALEERGFRCVEVPMDEFIKAGGSVKCLVLTLDSFAWARNH